MKNFLVLLAASILSACASAAPFTPLPNAGPPQGLSVLSDANPDVIWIVRQVDVTKRGFGGVSDTNAVLYGLFACYRQPASKAGPPQCYLANHSYKPEDLAWPGGLYLGSDGVLRPIYQPK